MFETRDFHKNVFIDGNILFDTDKEVSYLDIVAFSNAGKGLFEEVIIPDKSLFENGTTFNYVNNDSICRDDTIYHVIGEVASYGNEEVRENPYRCIFSYNYNIYGMSELLEENKNIDETGIKPFSLEHPYRNFSLSENIFRMIYLSIYSNYELFMMDILVTCYLRFQKVKEQYHERVRFNGLNEEEVIKKLKGYYYSNFEEVGNLFLTLLGVRIPDYKLLKKGYKKRDDIAHRYNFDKGGDIVKISINDLQELVREMNKFVYEVFNSVIKAVY
jgi:hypothetical protein